MDLQETNADSTISVLGMSCRFPGAINIDEYRNMLLSGKSAFCTVTNDTLNESIVPEEIVNDENYVNSAAPLDDVLFFDKRLSHLTEEQSNKIDPQFYHFWECTWEALENANCGFDKSNLSVGVFAGSDTSWFSINQMKDSLLWDPMGNWDSFFLNDSHFLSTWISHRFGFNGPSINIQTACSTSLVAAHIACNALIAGDCDIAVVGGVSIRGPQKIGYLYRPGGILSPSGICRPFDISSDGTVLSSGVGVVVLSRQEDALKNYWPILANIIGSSVNNDGDRKVAFTAPNGEAQQNLVNEAILVSGIKPESIGFIEAHGTGTEIGDAVEIQALANIFDKRISNRIFIGSCKSNFGHLESAAGIAGLIKTVLSVKNNEIYPVAHFKKANPKLLLKNTPFIIPTAQEKYNSNAHIRRAGVSSFGIGGTNCHVIIENAFEMEAQSIESNNYKCWPIFGISAMTGKAGKEYSRRLFQHLKEYRGDSIINICTTLLANRKLLPVRLAVPWSDERAGWDWLSAINDTDFINTQKRSANISISFNGPIQSFIGAAKKLKHANSILGTIIDRFSNITREAGISKSESVYNETAIVCFSISEWLQKLGVPIENIEGFFSHQLTAGIESNTPLNNLFLESLTLYNNGIPSTFPQNKTGSGNIVIKLQHPYFSSDISISLDETKTIGFQFAEALSYLWMSGFDIDWGHYFPKIYPVNLPTYPFQRERIVRHVPKIIQEHSNFIEKIEIDVQEFLSKLWLDILGHSHDECNDFFAINGDSLSAMQFATRINNELHISIMMEEIFETPHFEDIIDLVNKKLTETIIPVYPLSPNQEALYALCERSPEAPVYNVYVTYELRGHLNVDCLYSSFEMTLQKHDIFKTSFRFDDIDIKQYIQKDTQAFEWLYIVNISNHEDIKEHINKHIRKVFDLSKPPLLSVLLIKKSPEFHYLSVVTHHIVSDEWSAQIMFRDVICAYEAQSTNTAFVHSKLNKAYGEITTEENKLLRSNESLKAISFWKKYLEDINTFQNKMPSVGSHVESNIGDVDYFKIEKETYLKIKALARAFKTTPFVVLLTVFKVLISKYSGQSDLCVGINLANRNNTEKENVVGYFTNTLPLRTEILSLDSFESLIKKCHQSLVGIQKNQLPLSVIYENLEKKDKDYGAPLFDTVFVLQNVPRYNISFSELSMRKLPFHNGTSKFNLEFVLEPSFDDELSGIVEFKTDAFDRNIITQIIGHYKNLIEIACEYPFSNVYEVEMLNETEKIKLLIENNSHISEMYKQNSDLWDLFTQITKSDPESIAIICSDDKEITYSQLHMASLSLSMRIKQCNSIAPDSPVCIFSDRSENIAVALLSIQACGKAFIIIDPNMPNNRIEEIIHDCGARIFLTTTDHLPQLRSFLKGKEDEFELLTIDKSYEFPKNGCVNHQETNPSNLAYVMYTSGSTGKPKGALVTQDGMMNHLHEKIRTVGLEKYVRLAQTGSLSFDISIWQFLAPLMSGATLVLFSDEQIFDIDLYLTRIEEQHCDVVELVPSYLETILTLIEAAPPKFNALKCLISTGEALPTVLCNRWLAIYPHIPIINAYGPTECADDVLQYVIDKRQPEHILIPAGTPLANLQIYILDAAMQPVPPEVFGDIYVGGIGVGLGYLKDPEKTKACFLPNPFINAKDATIYKTGDLGAWKHDGSVVYLGRLDTQIKVNGARVELAEIDTVLNQCPQIRQSVSVYDPSRKTIAAFCIPHKHPLDVHVVKAYSQSHLPSYMCPSVFKQLDYIPRNNSGKVDRIWLRQLLVETDSDAPTIVPLTAEEAQLKEIWQHILGTDKISGASNFFDLGGNSLSAIRLVAMARKHNLMLSPKDVFRHPVLWDMAGQCSTQPESNTLDQTLLSDGEQQFFAINANRFKSIDSAFLVELASNIDAQTVQDAVAYVWGNYPGLRTRYAKGKDERWIKSQHSVEIVPFSMITLSPDIDPEQLKVVISGFREQLYLQPSRLFDTTLIQHGNNNLLLVRGHYLVCDFVSWQILLDEFFILLKDKVIFDKKDLNNRYHHIYRLPAHLTSEEGRDKNIEALLTIALDDLLASYFEPSNYNILIGHNARETFIADIIGRYSFIKQLPKLDHEGDAQIRIYKAKQIIATANKFNPMGNNIGWLISLDYLGTTDVRNRPSITRLSRGYLSSQSNQLFPIELIAWVQQDALFVEITTEKDKAPINAGTMQDQLSEILDRLVQQMTIMGGPS